MPDFACRCLSLMGKRGWAAIADPPAVVTAAARGSESGTLRSDLRGDRVASQRRPWVSGGGSAQRRAGVGWRTRHDTCRRGRRPGCPGARCSGRGSVVSCLLWRLDGGGRPDLGRRFLMVGDDSATVFYGGGVVSRPRWPVRGVPTMPWGRDGDACAGTH